MKRKEMKERKTDGSAMRQLCGVSMRGVRGQKCNQPPSYISIISLCFRHASSQISTLPASFLKHL